MQQRQVDTKDVTAALHEQASGLLMELALANAYIARLEHEVMDLTQALAAAQAQIPSADASTVAP